MVETAQKDTSMEAVAEAVTGHGEYVTEDGRKVKVYKVTVKDHAIVLKIMRSVATVIDEISGGAMSKGDVAKVTSDVEESLSSVDKLFMTAEENMPILIEVIYRLTDLSEEEVGDLPLSDLFDLLMVIWKVNHRFFTKAMEMFRSLSGSTPEQPSEMQSISKSKRKRTRKQ